MMKAKSLRQFRWAASLLNDLGKLHARNVGFSHNSCQEQNVEETHARLLRLSQNDPMPNPTTLAERLRALRDAHPQKPTQYDVAAAVGMSRAHLAKMETGAYTGGRVALRLLADFYGVSVDYLETGADVTGQHVPDKSFSSEDKRAWLLVGAALGDNGRMDVIRYIRERNAVRHAAENERRPRQKK